jgi:membrane dipeptidase
LDDFIAHIDHICQCIGDAEHVGLGSELTSSLGVNNIPYNMRSIADLPLTGRALQEYGYNDEDVNKIMGGNWIRILKKTFS